MMTLEEVEQRLRVSDMQGYGLMMADAISAHREQCVDAEKLKGVIRSMRANGMIFKIPSSTESRIVNYGYWPDRLESLLPPQKSALDRAIEMVEESSRPNTTPWIVNLLALLREAKEGK